MTAGAEVHLTQPFRDLPHEALLDAIRRSPVVVLATARITPKSNRQILLDYLLFGPLVVASFVYLPVFAVVAATIGYIHRPAMTPALVVAVLASFLKAFWSAWRELQRDRDKIEQARRDAGTKELHLDLVHRRLICHEALSSTGQQRTESVALSQIQFIKQYDEHPNPTATDDLTPDSYRIKVKYSLLDVATPWAREMLDRPIRSYDFSRHVDGHQAMFDRQASAVIDALNSRTHVIA